MGELNKLGQVALATAQSKGFMLTPNESVERHVSLMHSELSEALEADRNDRYTSPESNLEGALALEMYTDEQFIEFFEKNIKGNFEEEMADLLIRNIQYSAYKNIDLDTHVALKMRYNSLRKYKHGGKKY